MKCAQCSSSISEARPTDPVSYCDRTFCDMKCAHRWAFVQLPKELKRASLFRSGIHQILTHVRGRGLAIARETIREARGLETS